MNKLMTSLLPRFGFAVLALGIAISAHAEESTLVEDAQDTLGLSGYVFAKLQKAIAGNPLTSSEAEEEGGTELDCKDAFPPGGWNSFPLACRRFVGQMEVASDPEFQHVIMTFGIEQQGRLMQKPSGEIEYRFFLKLGKVRMKSEKVVWQSDRSYKIGKKISGLCNPESVSGSSTVVCRASFHGVMATVAGGYVETYYGPGLTKINLEWANSGSGHAPLLLWRASLTEAK
jgi:hypothetical protein